MSDLSITTPEEIIAGFIAEEVFGEIPAVPTDGQRWQASEIIDRLAEHGYRIVSTITIPDAVKQRLDTRCARWWFGVSRAQTRCGACDGCVSHRWLGNVTVVAAREGEDDE